MSPELSLRSFADAQRTQLSRDCPSLEWKVLEEGPGGFLIEWRHTGCQGYPAQHELSRSHKGRHGLHNLKFVRKTTKLPADVREKWVSALKKSHLVSPAPEFAFEIK